MDKRRHLWSIQRRLSCAMIIGLLVIITSTSPVAASTAGDTFGVSTVVAQLHPKPNQWLIAGMAPDPQGYGMLDLVLGGAIRKNGRWHVTYLDRYWTAAVAKPVLDFEVPCTSQVVRTHSAIVVGCLNGGSDFESFVVVLSLVRNLPRVNLAVTCSQTKWNIEGGAFVLTSSTLRGGIEDPGSPQPDVTLSWASAESPNMQPTTQAGTANFTKECTALNYEDMGPL